MMLWRVQGIYKERKGGEAKERDEKDNYDGDEANERIEQ